nr:DNA translocase FtsK [Klebsiella pneumoniae]
MISGTSPPAGDRQPAEHHAATLLHSSGGTIALLCIWAAGLTLFTGWSWVSIAEKLGGGILSVLTFASNRTRRDDTGR